MFKSLKKLSTRPQHQARRQNQLPTFETMEERRMMSGTYVVTNTADSGSGSLRDAITQVDAGKYSGISFDISKHDAGYNSTTGLYNINVKSQLPAITSPVLLDGYTQPGYAGSPIIEIDGKLDTSSTAPEGVVVESANVTVRGLSLDDFAPAIYVWGNGPSSVGNDVIDGNVIGMNPATRGDPVGGIQVLDVGTGCAIGQTVGNRIVIDNSNSLNAITITGMENGTVSNNTITAAGKGQTGIELGAYYTYGTTNVNFSKNDISGFQTGFNTTYSSSADQVTNNVFQNCASGINLTSTTSAFNVNGNNFSGGNGVRITVAGANNSIVGNVINASSAGMRVSTGDGIDVTGNSNTIQGNTIQQMSGDAIKLSAGATNNTMVGNTISTCFYGVEFDNADGNILGGYDNPADSNSIQATTDVTVTYGSYDDAIVGNALSGSHGIYLNGTGNQGQAAPILKTVNSAFAGPILTGTVHTVANRTVRFELFANGAYIGAEIATSDANGNAAFTDTFTSHLIGENITATATVMQPSVTFVGRFAKLSYLGETSQFSNPLSDFGVA